jgi:cell division protein ZapA (FtsZ GTPase activity inhibitor)
MASTVRETTVTIRGTSFQLRTDLDDEHLREMASYVDAKLSEISPGDSFPSAKASLLASLLITGELLEERQQHATVSGNANDRFERIHRMLDEALGEG